MPSSAKLGKQEPSFQWAFYVVIPSLGDDAQYYVATVTLPSVTWETTEVPYFSQKKKFASRFNVNEMTCVLKDYVDFNTAAKAWKWWNSVGDIESGTVKVPSEYKKDGSLLKCDGRGSPIQTWKLQGCFPSAMEFGDLDYSGTDIVQISITLTIDKVSAE
jgi:hypothetical protein